MDKKKARQARSAKLKLKRANKPVSNLPVRYGVQSLNSAGQKFYNEKGVEFKPILQYKPLTKDEESRLKNEYYVKNNRVGFEKLYQAVRKSSGTTDTGKPVFSPSRVQVQAWLSTQLVALDYKPIEKSKENRPILVSKIGELMQIDYLDMSDRHRSGKHRYILNAIDVLSKKGYTRSPVNITGTGATAAQTLTAFKSIMVEYKKDYGKYPDRIQSDNGSHFLGAFEKAFQPGGFFHQKIRYNSGLRYRATSQSVVERFNGTLRNMIRRYMNDTEQGGNDWFKHLQQFCANYNSNKHSGLKIAPNKANNYNVQEYKDNAKERAILRNKNLQRLDLGDKVRLKNFKKAKGSDQYKDEPNWWPEIYEIFYVWNSKVGRAPEYSLEPNPPTTLVNRPGYQGPLKEPRRKFTIYELQKLAEKGDKNYGEYTVTTQAAVDDIELEDDESDTVPVYKSPDIIKKKIQVKFYDSASKSYVVDAQSIIRRKKSTGTFYEGLVMRFNKKTLEHVVKFKDGLLALNFTKEDASNFIPKIAWRLAK